jgi:hypothetical protein
MENEKIIMFLCVSRNDIIIIIIVKYFIYLCAELNSPGPVSE